MANNEDNNTEDTFITIRSILTEQEKQNIALKRMLRRTNATIAKTKKRIEELKRRKVWAEHNLYDEYHMR